jgi:nucleotide-binding universal stress UspA family protein
MGRSYGASVHTLHVLVTSGNDLAVPTSVPLEEERKAEDRIRRLESQFLGLAHEEIVEQGSGVWPVVQRVIQERQIDLVIVGAHGRTSLQRLVLGSVAQEIFRRSPVPVLTIGVGTRGGGRGGVRLRGVLLATDFASDAEAAVPYAVSLARQHGARLILIHVLPGPTHEDRRRDLSVAEMMHALYETIPKGTDLPFPLEVAVGFGRASQQIVKAARERKAELIVMGAPSARDHLRVVKQRGPDTAHRVVVESRRPVLLVRARSQ